MRRLIRILLLVFCVLLVLAAVGALVLYHAAQQVPDFYREALAKPPESQEKQSAQMIEQVAAINNNLHTEGKWQMLITAEQINGWLAVDMPRNHANLLPAEFQDPRVQIEPDGITLACRLNRGRMRSVVSLKVDAYLTAPNTLGLRIRQARVGTVPWPLEQVRKAIAEAARHADLHVQTRQAGGDPVVVIDLPPMEGKHGRTVRIETLELQKGAIGLAGVTERAAKK